MKKNVSIIYIMGLYSYFFGKSKKDKKPTTAEELREINAKIEKIKKLQSQLEKELITHTNKSKKLTAKKKKETDKKEKEEIKEKVDDMIQRVKLDDMLV